MTTPISFAVKPPPAASYRPSPLGNGSGSRSRAGPPSRRLFEQGDEDEDEDERRRGSSSSRRPREERAEPLVIAALPNRDWRESSRRTPTYRPEARQVAEEDAITHERTGDGPQRSGIRRIVKEEVKVEPGVGESSTVQVKREETFQQGEASAARTTTKTTVNVKAEPLTEEEKLHQEALAALLAGRSDSETEDERAQRELRIEMQQNKLNLSEEDAFKRDMKTLPAEVSSSNPLSHTREADLQSTLDDYENIPVSAFGLAMARGMGWDPKGNDNTTVHEPKQRPQLLGLGATPMDPTIRPTHNKTSKKDRQADRNAKSGRGFVATSLLVKKEREGSDTPVASRSGSPGSEKRRREDGDDRDAKRERTDRYDDRDRNGRDRGNGASRRYETEEERARRKARERERDYETEEERARRKARERERDRERGGDYETEEQRARRKARERDGEYETEEQRARRKARERERDQDRERDRRR